MARHGARRSSFALRGTTVITEVSRHHNDTGECTKSSVELRSSSPPRLIFHCCPYAVRVACAPAAVRAALAAACLSRATSSRTRHDSAAPNSAHIAINAPRCTQRSAPYSAAR